MYDNAKKMIMDSRYPIDKVVFLATGNFSIGASSSQIISFTHGLSFIPLCSGNWSTVSDFSIQYEYSSGTYSSSYPGYLFDTFFNIYADSTSVYVDGYNLGAAKTIYIRIYAFEPPTSQALIAGIASSGDKFVVDSRLKYPKLFMNNYIDIPAGGMSDTFVYVDHNIGTIPQAMGWIHANTWNGSELVDAVHPASSTHSNAAQNRLIAGSERIAFSVPAGEPAHRAYYRIYLDE